MLIATHFIIALLSAITNIYLMTKIIKSNHKKINTIIGIIFLTIGILITKFTFTNSFYIPIFNFILSLITCIIIFPKNIDKSLMSTFISFTICIISEIIITLSVVILKIDLTKIGIILNLIANILIIILSICIINIPFIQKNIDLILKNFEKHKLTISLIIISILIFLIIKNFPVNNNILIIISFIFIIIIITLLFYNLLEQEKIKQNNLQYNELLKIANDYEKIIDKRMKMTHEYKNNLLLIKAMADSKNKQIHNYIDQLMSNINSKIDQKLLLEIKKIPIKTFNGMLYQKMLKADNENIDIQLDISNKLTDKKIQNINEKDIIDLCKLTGIFMDNAIDASKDVDEKQISISIYLDKKNNLVISIANKFYGIIDTKNMKSTKGKNNGYGLLIAKDIINKNQKINNTCECISNVFIQNIVLDLN